MTKVYVVTDGGYSDYHVAGVFSTYKKARRYGPDIFVTELDQPVDGGHAGCWTSAVALGNTTAYYSAPSDMYRDDPHHKFHWGDVIYEKWVSGVPEETPPEQTHRKVCRGFGSTKELARRAAMDFAREHRVSTSDTAICPGDDPHYDDHAWYDAGISSNTSTGLCATWRCRRCSVTDYRGMQ